jgi:hypothetical protein
MVRLEGVGQLKNPVTSSGIEPKTFRLVAIVPQPTTLLHAPDHLKGRNYIGELGLNGREIC